MDALTANMVQHEVLLGKVEEALTAIDSKLDSASASESLTKLIEARQKFDDKHVSLREKYEEASEYLKQLVKRAKLLSQDQKIEEEKKEVEKTQIVTIGSEILRRKLEKTIGDYVQECITERLEELSSQILFHDTLHLKQVLPHLIEDLDINVNKKALARLTSPNLPFIPTKVIPMIFMNEDYSELRKLHDFKNFKDLITLRYDREMFV